jgi:hypothetical protein
MWPVFGANWVEGQAVLPRTDMQIYGAGMNVALSERFSVGLVQGGYGYLNIAQRSRAETVDGLRSLNLLSAEQRNAILQRASNSPLLEGRTNSAKPSLPTRKNWA